MTEEAASSAEQENTPAPDPGESGSQEGTPAEPAEGSTAPEHDYEQRYNDLQPEYTRATQENAMLRQIVDLAREGDPEALEYLGYEAPDTDTEDDDEPTVEDEVAQLKEWKQQRESAEEQQAEELETEDAWQRFYESEFDKLDADGKWDDDYRAKVVGIAQQLPPAEDGLPDLEAGHKALDEWFESRFNERVKSKRSPQAPSGANASHQPDLDDPEQRRDFIARRLAEQEPAA